MADKTSATGSNNAQRVQNTTEGTQTTFQDGSTVQTSTINDLNNVPVSQRESTNVAYDKQLAITKSPTTTAATTTAAPKTTAAPVINTTTKTKKTHIAYADSKGLYNPLPIYTDEITDNDRDLYFYLPQWGVNEYINDRTLWQKQMYTFGAEQGWFYFKIFFNFGSSHGLLSDLISESAKSIAKRAEELDGEKADNSPYASKQVLSRHSALYYLASIEDRYIQEQIPHRMLALYKFGSLLKSIQTETPWLFKGVNGLDAVNGTNVTEITKDKSIEISLNTETLDTRLGTLCDLYKYACYDPINSKEIIPANLRKFDMCVLVYNQPVKYLQTGLWEKELTGNKSTYKKIADAKTTDINRKDADFSNMMSFKLYTFHNCEFDISTLNTYVPNSLSNEQAFNLGSNNIKINYYRAYEHRMNEFGEFMFGSTGFMYNEYLGKDQYIGEGALGITNQYDENGIPNSKPTRVGQEYKINAKGNDSVHAKRIAAITKDSNEKLATGNNKIKLLDDMDIFVEGNGISYRNDSLPYVATNDWTKNNDEMKKLWNITPIANGNYRKTNLIYVLQKIQALTNNPSKIVVPFNMMNDWRNYTTKGS